MIRFAKPVAATLVVAAALVAAVASRTLGRDSASAIGRCAPCHGGGNPDGLYADWRASPWARPNGGRGCHDCHDPSQTALECDVAWREFGAAVEKPDHRPPAAELRLSVRRAGEHVEIEATMVNTGTGHRLPGTGRRRLELELRLVARNGSMASTTTVTPNTIAPFASEVHAVRLPDTTGHADTVEATLRLGSNVPSALVAPERILRSATAVIGGPHG